MRIVIIALLMCIGVEVQAFSTSIIAPSQPFEPVVISHPDHDFAHTYLGTLVGHPDMLEFSLFSTTSLDVQLWQRPSEEPLLFGFIIVKVNEGGRGVTEVARAHQQTVVWESAVIQSLGTALSVSNPIPVTLEPGQYRLEVSTPTNEGAYALRFLPLSNGSYFASVASAYRTLQHFSFGPFVILRSPYIYYPLGSVLLLIGITLTWRYRTRFIHAS